MYQQDLYTVPTSLAGLPAMSIPGFSQGLPRDAVAPAFREDLLDVSANSGIPRHQRRQAS